MEYTSLNLHDHVLKRPETYVGSVHPELNDDYILTDNTITKHSLHLIPAVTRLFNEVLSNAIDNKFRSLEHNVPCTTIKVDIDQETGCIAIWNDGLCIPHTKNKEGIYIPEMIFGTLLTSSNYNDTEQRLTVGRNGLGVKLCNIFSSRFSVESTNPASQTKYSQTWTRNMKDCSKPKITKYTKPTGYTRVEWVVDFAYFKLERYDDSFIALFTKHVYDTAMITGLTMILNGRKLPIKTFKDYVKLYTESREILVFPSTPSVSFALVPSTTGSFENVSFVNGIHTVDGGIHVDIVSDAVFKPLLKEIQRKLKNPKLTLRDMKSNFVLFVNCSVPNPEFSSQSKTKMTAPRFSVKLDDKEILPVLKWEFMNRLKEQLEQKETLELNKSAVKKRGYTIIPGYDVANRAGGRDSLKCTLILCEGLSAKTFGVIGIDTGIDFGPPVGFTKGRDWYGIMPLKGKCFGIGTMVSTPSGKRPIEELVRGDAVISDEGYTQHVLHTLRGIDTLYEIRQSGGDTYVVTGDHTLVLQLVYRNVTTWDEERQRWVFSFWDAKTFAPEQVVISCGERMTKEQGLEAIEVWRRENPEYRWIHLYVSDYIKLGGAKQSFLKGIVMTRVNGRARYAQVDIQSVREVGMGSYAGIRVGGTHRFVLGGGTVVHNCLNVRGATKARISENKEITGLVQAMGLRYGVDYTNDDNFKTLNYGRILLLTDSDCDGLHIQGLIMNLLHALFPSLMNRQGFLLAMNTPIMKVEYKSQIYRFYNSSDAEAFLQKHPTAVVKYLKGLGTSTDKDVKETFGKQVVQYLTENVNDVMDLVFDKRYADQRKEWMKSANVMKERLGTVTRVENVISTMRIADFLNTELVQFSLADCHRNIPCLFDGLKESQRKILYACFLKGMTPTTSIKVAQLSGYVAERTGYHHGEVSLQGAIINMAQDYIGSNNIPLFTKDGQVGTRVQNGADSASSRYVFVKLGEKTRLIYPKEDDENLTYIKEEGETIEPHFYVPIIPMLLVNGSVGIGTGYSCNIPSYNPTDIVRWIKAWLKGGDKPTLVPWYNGFTGIIEQETPHRFSTYGVMERIKSNRVLVTEIPIGKSIDAYKEFLEGLLVDKQIKDFRNLSNPDRVYFEISEHPDGFTCTIDTLNLKSVVSTSNLVVLGMNKEIVKYAAVDELMEDFCKVRLDYYTQRRKSMLKSCETELELLSNRLRFLKEVMSERVNVFKVERKAIEECLSKRKFSMRDGGFGYLIDMPIASFTDGKLASLEESLRQCEKQVDYWKRVDEKKLWISDLDRFVALNKN